MDPFPVICIAIFVAIAIASPLAIKCLALCLDRRKYHPGRRVFQHAQVKLRDVVETAKGIHPATPDALCAICMGQLDKVETATLPKDDSPETQVLSAPARVVVKPVHKDTPEQPEDDDQVVSLKRCHHCFHSNCLTRWFLTGRHDCPVCRSIFWGRPRQGQGTGRPGEASRPYANAWASWII